MGHATIDHSRYLHFGHLGVRSGLSLGRMLLAAIPEDPGPGVLAGAQLLHDGIEQLKAQWRSKARKHSAEDVRPHDHRLDRAWSAVERSLDRYTIFDAGHAKRMRATQLHERLFPTGLGFIKLPYIEQHAESDQRIDVIEEEGLRADLSLLVGEDFIDELMAAHIAYGVALRITEGGEDAPPISLVAPLRVVTEAISGYVLQVLAFAGLDPEKNTEAARRALRPIDALRRASARRGARRGGKEVEIDDEALADEMVPDEGEVEGEGEGEAVELSATMSAA